MQACVFPYLGKYRLTSVPSYLRNGCFVTEVLVDSVWLMIMNAVGQLFLYIVCVSVLVCARPRACVCMCV